MYLASLSPPLCIPSWAHTSLLCKAQSCMLRGTIYLVRAPVPLERPRGVIRPERFPFLAVFPLLAPHAGATLTERHQPQAKAIDDLKVPAVALLGALVTVSLLPRSLCHQFLAPFWKACAVHRGQVQAILYDQMKWRTHSNANA